MVSIYVDCLLNYHKNDNLPILRISIVQNNVKNSRCYLKRISTFRAKNLGRIVASRRSRRSRRHLPT
jgi:hypothetical protein